MKTVENGHGKQNIPVENLKRSASWLVALAIILTITFYFLEIQAGWDSSILTLLLNIGFVIIPALVIAFIAARSFLCTGVWPVLWMGIGVLTFGLAAVLSNWFRITSGNNATTVYSIVALLAGVFHFFAGFFSLNQVSPRAPGSGRLFALLQVYLVAMALIVSVAVIGGLGMLPPFVVAGIGTPIRVIVQVTATALFLLAGLMLFRQSLNSKSSLLYWYSLGLLLFCLSMIGALLQETAGSPISWTARIAQYLGGAYLFVAALVILREAKSKELPVDETIANQFSILEARLKESEENYLNLFNNMSEGFAVCEMLYDQADTPVDYRFLNVNPEFEKFLGLSRDQIVGSSIRTIAPNVQAQAIENFGKVVSTGDPVHFENYSRDLNKWFDVYAFKSAPRQFGYMVLDITERKKAEEELKRYTAELESANQELESFAYSVSHDLRQPLRALDGFSEMVIIEYGDKLDETGKDHLNRIRKAGQTMSQLTEDILKLSRITRAEMHRNEVNLSEMAKSIADELRATQPERQAEFSIAPSLIVKGDKALLQILLRNLLENSWKYTGKCPDAHIEIGVNHQDGKRVYFIQDNGIGFDMKYKDKLFQPFQRLHTSKDYPGTGIGLATAQRVVRRHGGQIWAESEIGKGTIIYFILGD